VIFLAAFIYVSRQTGKVEERLDADGEVRF